jgi:hypothetical protein
VPARVKRVSNPLLEGTISIMPLVSEAVANAKADLDRHSNEIQEWAQDFLTLLSPEWQARDLVFIEAKDLQPN